MLVGAAVGFLGWVLQVVGGGGGGGDDDDDDDDDDHDDDDDDDDANDLSHSHPGHLLLLHALQWPLSHTQHGRGSDCPGLFKSRDCAQSRLDGVCLYTNSCIALREIVTVCRGWL